MRRALAAPLGVLMVLLNLHFFATSAAAAGPYVGRVGSVTLPSGGTSVTVPVGATGVGAGHALVVSLLLSSTSSLTGSVSGSDTAGDGYALGRDVNDGSAGDRSLLMVAMNTKAMAAGATIKLTFPSSAEVHVSVDEFTGVTAVDTSAGASGSSAAFSSGSAAASQASEILFGSVGVESGSSPAWAAGWSALPALAVSTDFLGSAYEVVAAPGSFAATGTTRGTWMAGILVLKAGPSVPTAPLGLSAVAGNGQVAMSWQAPASNGGAAVSSYSVYRSTTSGAETLLASGVGGLSYTDLAVTNGTTYFYKVAAVNSLGAGPLSGEASATPATLPGPPQNPAAVAGNGQVAVSWQAPASNGGAAVSSYSLYRSTTSGTETLLTSGITQLSASDTAVTTGTTYFYKVAAANSAGVGTQSAEVSATPQAGPPSAPQSLSAVAGNGQVALAWQPPASSGGSSVTGYNVYRSASSGTETLLASGITQLSYSDAAVTNGTTYFYKVAAVNSAGPGGLSNEASATPAAPPAAPQNLGAVAGNGQVALTWQAPSSNGGAVVTSYNLYRSTTSGAETLLASGITQLSASDTAVINGITYYYKVAAVNSAGVGAQSVEVLATPQAGAPSAPLSLSAVAGNGQVSLAWQAPASNGGSAITGYNVYQSTASGTETLLAAGITQLGYTDTTVTNGTTYFYKVAAVNSAGAGGLSNEASATPAAPPSAPQNLMAVAGNGQVALSWQAPASNGGAAVTSYNLYRSTSSGTETLLASGLSLTTYNDTGLTNATTYYYKVAAVNSAGVGLQSLEATATPQAAAPSAPLSLSAVAGNGQVSLSWQAPASNGGAPVTSYSLYRSITSGTETLLASGITQLSYTDVGLTNGTPYFYKVLANNTAGQSPASNEVSATPAAPPAAVYIGRIGSLTMPAGGTSASVTVGAAGVGAGHGIVVSLLLSSTSVTGALSATDTAGNSYVIVRDVNDGSAGDRTVVLAAFNAKSLPAGGRITLTFSTSAEVHLTVDEFAGITAVDASSGASATSAAFSSGAAATSQASDILFGAVGIESGSTPAWAAGWTPLPTLAVSTDVLGSAYRIVNTAGSYTASGTGGGTWMAGIVAFKAGPSVPTAPLGLSAVAGNGQVAMSWQAPASNGGAAVSSYSVYRSTTSGAETLLASGVGGLSYTDLAVTNGTTYFYKVAAVNSLGAGPLSGEASATPAAPPSAPQNLVAAAGNGQVALTWQAPASNGGAAVTSYSVYRSTSSGTETLLASGISQLGYTDSATPNGTTYYYRVLAVNSAGFGALSNEASATPQAGAPSAPLSLSAVAGNGQVSLSWQAPASNGGSAITGYNVYQSTASGTETLLAAGITQLGYTDTTVTNGTTYFYKVAAVNSAGAGGLSNEASATPAAPPSAPQNLMAVAGNGQVALTWQAPASNGGAAVTSYSVYRSTSSGTETLLASGISHLGYTDGGANNGTTYYYAVLAVNSAGFGALSNEASATPQPVPPSAPQNLVAVAGNGQVSLSWQAPASNGGAAVTSYSVYRSTSSGTETLLASGVTALSYTDSATPNGTTYYYKVLAVNSAGPGVLSNEASATPQAPAGGPVAVYAGYFDDHHPGSPQPQPNPWLGSPNVIFVGLNDSGQVGPTGWDTSTVRIDNLSGASMSINVTVDIGGSHFDLWGTQSVPAGGSLIVAQMGYGNFDGSDTNPGGCYGCAPQTCLNVMSTIPVVHVTINGKTTDYFDTGQVLNTHGVDSAGCPYDGNRNDESIPWSRLGG